MSSSLPRGTAALPGDVAIIGGGPAGLMAAEVLAAQGLQVDLFDAMPSVGRKFLLAGKGGLNLTHAEPADLFKSRYGDGQAHVAHWLGSFGQQAVREWAQGLGIATFVGSSGKVFPDEMKAAPLLRAWVHRLRAAGVRLHGRHRWVSGTGLVPDETGQHALQFESSPGALTWHSRAVVLALGGASWSRLGSDGLWQEPLAQSGVSVTPLRAANCGFDLTWSKVFAAKHAGAPLKNVVLRHRATARDGQLGDIDFERLGECVVSAGGLEGTLMYAASASLQHGLAASGASTPIELDLLPHMTLEVLSTALMRGRGTRSLSNHVKEQAGLSGVRFMLLREGLDAVAWQALGQDMAALARRIKAMPLTVLRARPIDEAISSAGGVALAGLNEHLMLHDHPGVFCAGEMLDWDAPTGGYLLTACLATGRLAGQGAADWLARIK